MIRWLGIAFVVALIVLVRTLITSGDSTPAEPHVTPHPAVIKYLGQDLVDKTWDDWSIQEQKLWNHCWATLDEGWWLVDQVDWAISQYDYVQAAELMARYAVVKAELDTCDKLLPTE